MRDFTMVSPAVWKSKRFLSLDDDAKLLHLFLLTCGHQNSAGCFCLPPGYAAVDLGWELSRFTAALAALCQAGLIDHDEHTDEVLIRRWFKHCAPKNPSHRKGIESTIRSIESETLQEKAHAALTEADEAKRATKSPTDADNVEPLNRRIPDPIPPSRTPRPWAGGR